MPISPANKGRHQVPFTEERLERVLAALAEGYSITGAALKAGVGRRTVYDHIEKNPVFAAAVKEAMDMGTDRLEDLLLQKAEQPQGFLANIASLKARRPEKWREIHPISTGPSFNIIINAPSPEELRKIVEGDYRLLPDAPEEEPDR